MENQQNQVISTGNWIVTILITAIPLVGFIMLFVWGFGSNTIASKANWAKAMLIWYLISIVLGTIILFAFGAAIFALNDSDVFM